MGRIKGSSEEDAIIPGLPADVALDCLARLPFTHLPALRLTSSLWSHHLLSPHFHSLRKSLRLTRHLIALLSHSPTKGPTASPVPSYRLVLLDPSAATWHPLPPVPGLPLGLPLFPRVVPAGRRLAVLGGSDPLTWAATDGIFIYDPATGSWRAGAPMPGPKRSFFGCASTSGSGRVLILVAGGHDERKDALRSALVYDVEKDKWAPLPAMRHERDECAVVYARGRFHVVGGYATVAQGRFERSAESFDVDKWEWGPVEEGFLCGATCPRACSAGESGEVYVCEAGNLAVSDAGSMGWRNVAALPEEMRAALQTVTWQGRVMVMGSGFHSGAQVCYLLDGKQGDDHNNNHNNISWTRLEMPPEYSGHIQAACCLEI